MQAPLAHEEPATTHSSLQAPQLLGSDCKATQALAGDAPPLWQRVSPLGQAHRPATQLAPSAQIFPQPPQLLTSDWVSTQALLALQNVGVVPGQPQLPP